VLKASEAHNLTEVEAPGVRPAETFSSSLLPTLHRNQGFLFFHIFSQIGDETSFFVAGVATKFIFHLYFTIIFIQNIDFSSKCAILILGKKESQFGNKLPLKKKANCNKLPMPMIPLTTGLNPYNSRGIFHQNYLKTAPIQNKIDYANFESLLVHLTVISCS
jgi:hypothetical protein